MKNLKLERVEIKDNSILLDGKFHIERYAFVNEVIMSDSEKIENALDDLNLNIDINSKVFKLSGGEQQRVAIARALAKNPKLLLCDEPTGALDYKTGKNILSLLQETCQKEKTTVVVITHNAALAPIAKRVIEINDAQVREMYTQEPKNIESIEW